MKHLLFAPKLWFNPDVGCLACMFLFHQRMLHVASKLTHENIVYNMEQYCFRATSLEENPLLGVVQFSVESKLLQKC
jgi:hypothetical protein